MPSRHPRSAEASSQPRRIPTRPNDPYLALRDLDWTLLLIVLMICAVGVLQIFSATRDTVGTTPGGSRSSTSSADWC